MAIKDKKGTKISLKKLNVPTKPRGKFLKPIFAVGGYFKGSWQELRQVRWPNRRASWGMTAAVLMFTGMFLALIVALDAFFGWIFKLIIK